MTPKPSQPRLGRGDHVPHFEATTLEGAPVNYRTIWQQRNLVLIALPPGAIGESADYVAQFTGRAAALSVHQTQCVATRDAIPGIDPPAVLVADRWGEVMYAANRQRVADLPAVDEVLEWLEYVQHRCPECEGEAR